MCGGGGGGAVCSHFILTICGDTSAVFGVNGAAYYHNKIISKVTNAHLG